MQLHREIQGYLSTLPVKIEYPEDSETDSEERRKEEQRKEEFKNTLQGDNYSTDLAKWTKLFNVKKLSHNKDVDMSSSAEQIKSMSKFKSIKEADLINMMMAL